MPAVSPRTSPRPAAMRTRPDAVDDADVALRQAGDPGDRQRRRAPAAAARCARVHQGVTRRTCSSSPSDAALTPSNRQRQLRQQRRHRQPSRSRAQRARRRRQHEADRAEPRARPVRKRSRGGPRAVPQSTSPPFQPASETLSVVANSAHSASIHGGATPSISSPDVKREASRAPRARCPRRAPITERGRRSAPVPRAGRASAQHVHATISGSHDGARHRAQPRAAPTTQANQPAWNAAKLTSRPAVARRRRARPRLDGAHRAPLEQVVADPPFAARVHSRTAPRRT